MLYWGGRVSDFPTIQLSPEVIDEDGSAYTRLRFSRGSSISIPQFFQNRLGTSNEYRS